MAKETKEPVLSKVQHAKLLQAMAKGWSPIEEPVVRKFQLQNAKSRKMPSCWCKNTQGYLYLAVFKEDHLVFLTGEQAGQVFLSDTNKLRQTLPQELNMQFKGLEFKEKMKLLQQMKTDGLVSEMQFNYFSNLWTTKHTKKIIKQQKEMQDSLWNPMDDEAQCFYSNLHTKLDNYLIQRSGIQPLEHRELQQFCDFIYRSRISQTMKNKLIILGLRFPDRDLTELCNEFIDDYCKDPTEPNFHFWIRLWEDGNLVPMDAIRQMLVLRNGKYEVDINLPYILIKELLPMITIQRDKELYRLQMAEQIIGSERETQVARKQRRLEMFNLLLEACKKRLTGE